MNKKALFFFLAISLFLCNGIQAQSSGMNSPYSRYGWGGLNDESQGFSLGMAGAGLGMRGPHILNSRNPASYAVIDSLTFLFDIGLSMSNTNMNCNGTSTSAQNSTLDYVTAGFRIIPTLGFAIGLRPFTTIGYNFYSNTQMEDIDGYGEKNAKYTYTGEGGTRLLFGGLGWAPFKNLSIGANIGYLWGNYTHNSTVTFTETTIQALRRYYMGELSTYSLNFGVQFTQPIGKQTSINIGLTADLGHKMGNSSEFINQKTGTSTVEGADTVYVKDAFELPTSVGAGIVLNHQNRWIIATDYTLQMWSKCRSPQLTTKEGIQKYSVVDNALSNRHKVSLGVQYVPKPDGFRFSNRINYRAGISYATSYYKVGKNDGPKTYLATLGVAFPIFNQYSRRSIVSIAAEYKRIQPSISNSIKENYFSLRLGLLFNGAWFNKWKVE